MTTARVTRARLAVTVSARQLPPAARGLGVWLVSAGPASARGAVDIALVSDATMRRLNRTYRGIDRATDVLSFPAELQLRAPPTSTWTNRSSLANERMTRGESERISMQHQCRNSRSDLMHMCGRRDHGSFLA